MEKTMNNLNHTLVKHAQKQTMYLSDIAKLDKSIKLMLDNPA